jgi:hypothetical protein
VRENERLSLDWANQLVDALVAKGIKRCSKPRAVMPDAAREPEDAHVTIRMDFSTDCEELNV